MMQGEAGAIHGRPLVDSCEQHIVIDQLFVDRALPAAVKAATGALVAERTGFLLPSFLAEADGGCPVYDPATLGLASPPTPLANVAVPGAPKGAFVVKLS